MDFIVALLKTPRGRDFITVVAYWFTKMAYVVPWPKVRILPMWLAYTSMKSSKSRGFIAYGELKCLSHY